MYETVIGLEIHVQLSTESKLFCSCSTKFTHEENINICPVCSGHLGSLPVLNRQAVVFAVKAGLALNCKINKFSMFDRKNYFYPDLPKGYQISQFYHPCAEYGYLDISNKRVVIRRIHIEEDAGKLIHNEFKSESYVDWNRSSVPLIEVVTNPDLSSPEEAQEFLTKLRTIIKYSGISDVNMELGSLRCDANVSIKKKEDVKLGTRVEIKNLNSFKSITKAINYEVERQKELLESGEEVTCETRLWDDNQMITKSMRNKEGEDDYRYFPDPDLLPTIIDDKFIEDIKQTLPEFPDEKIERFIKDYEIPEYDAKILSTEKELADYFEEVVKYSKNAKSSSNWIMTEVLRSTIKISAINLGKMIKMIDDNVINGKIAKELFVFMTEEDRDPEILMKEKGLIQISDESAIEKIVIEILKNNPKSIEQYKSGLTKVLGFLVGQVMQKTQGKANPELVNKIILSKINS